jgi:hypothetical protein
MTVMTARDEVAAAYAAALERKQDRRNVYRSYTEAERRQAWLKDRPLPNISINAPEFREPKTAGEFFDDRIIERGKLTGFPETPVLVAIAAAARESAAAAVAAAKAAKGLERPVQAVAYANLLLWKGHPEAGVTDAERVVVAVLNEWSRLRLTETMEDDDE